MSKPATEIKWAARDAKDLSIEVRDVATEIKLESTNASSLDPKASPIEKIVKTQRMTIDCKRREKK